jgi:hypothetical protein
LRLREEDEATDMGTVRGLRGRVLTATVLAALSSLLTTAVALAGTGPGPWPK